MKKYLILTLCLFSFIALQANKENPKIQVALLLDTSGSMDGLIEQAKGQLWKIVNELAVSKKDGRSPDIEIALYQYGNDGISARTGHVEQISPLTTDLDIISDKLFRLSTNGGNEYCGQVIQTSLDKLVWSDNEEDLKLIFIAGNESFAQGGINYKTSLQNAILKNVIVNTIFCGPEHQGVQLLWKEGADLAEGKYLSLNHNEAVVHINAPQDERIVELNNKLNDTYITYSSASKAKKELVTEQDKNAKSFGTANSVQRAIYKSSTSYNTGSFDFIEAVEEEPELLDSITELDLPEEFEGKDEEEVKVLLEEKKVEREKIVAEINSLQKERDDFVTQKKAELGEENGLDAIMLQSIKEQACSKNFDFE